MKVKDATFSQKMAGGRYRRNLLLGRKRQLLGKEYEAGKADAEAARSYKRAYVAYSAAAVEAKIGELGSERTRNAIFRALINLYRLKGIMVRRKQDLKRTDSMIRLTKRTFEVTGDELKRAERAAGS